MEKLCLQGAKLGNHGRKDEDRERNLKTKITETQTIKVINKVRKYSEGIER